MDSKSIIRAKKGIVKKINSINFELTKNINFDTCKYLAVIKCVHLSTKIKSLLGTYSIVVRVQNKDLVGGGGQVIVWANVVSNSLVGSFLSHSMESQLFFVLLVSKKIEFF